MPEEKEIKAAPEAGNDVKEVSSKEGLFGALLMVGVFVLIIAALGLIGWYGYAGWQGKQVEERAPSITSLQSSGFQPMEKEAVGQPVTKDEPKQEETKKPEETVKDVKSVQISVLNGGAAKGSAGVVADMLKKEGYTKVTAGNATGDYTGTVVYYGSGLEKEADAVRAGLIKKYPQVTVKPAVATNKETATAPLTVILGK